MPEPSSPAPPPRVEWQVERLEPGLGPEWVPVSGHCYVLQSTGLRALEWLRRHAHARLSFRLIRRSWRLESEEEVVDA